MEEHKPNTSTETIGIIFCIVCLIIGLIACFSGYLPKRIVADYDRSLNQLKVTNQDLESYEANLNKEIAKYSKFQLNKIAIAEGWNYDLEQLKKNATQLIQQEESPAKDAKTAVIYLKKRDDAKDAPAISQHTFELKQAAQRLQEGKAILQRKVSLIIQDLKLLENQALFLLKVQNDASFLKARANSKNFELAQLVAEMSKEFEPKRKDLESHLTQLNLIAKNSIKTINPETKKEDEVDVLINTELNKSEKDYLRIVQLSKQLGNAREEYRQQEQSLQHKIKELNISWDEILTDMKIDETVDNSTFSHQLKRVTLTYDPKSKTSTNKTEEHWKKINASQYKKHEKNLGMVIRSKKRGNYETEAKEVPASPPGYRYVGDTRYGNWQGSGSSRFWVFYGQYKFMETLFWGPSYRYIPYSRYDSYYSNYRSGRSYYGNGEYGTFGNRTKSRYSNSYYHRNKGFKDTGWKSSGGTRSGKRYSPSYKPPRTSSPSSRSRSFGSGSRSFGK